MASIFSRIVAGEIPCYKIAEDDRFFAFLDISPMKRGHTLVIPKEEKDYLFDYDDETVGGILVFAKKVAAAIRKAVPCQRIAMMVLGLEVPHAHIHLIPIDSEKDCLLSNPKLQLSPEEFTAIAESIRKNL